MHHVIALLHRGDGHLLAAHAERLRILLEFFGQAADFGRHGGREKRCLALGRRGRQDGFNVLNEAHAEHLVGLIQHHRANALQVQFFALHQVHDAPGRADHDIHAAAQRRDLQAVRLAAINGQHARLQGAAKAVKHFGHLQGQLAGGHQHQTLNLVGAG